ncbi:hypothetical protein ACCO45_011939 [Purpureocillium lilacinum]|uniref:Uncharacterized protein n=1 Tax=Purpureocillium lilacinum TaxID=33203 RepID=A0ACC4DCZ0_PURLI
MPPQTPRPTPSSRRRDSSPWDSSPNCKYALPTANVQELKRELRYRPLSTDFWIPIPSRAIITAFLNATPVPLVLERDQAVRTEHKMAGLIHGVLLRHFLIRQLRVMLYDDDGGDVKGGAQLWRSGGEEVEDDNKQTRRRVHGAAAAAGARRS